MIGVKAQETFIDLSYPEDVAITYNNGVLNVSIVNKVVLPSPLPDVGVETENIFKIESPAEGDWKDWYNCIVTPVDIIDISATQNCLKLLVYPSNSSFQFLLKDSIGIPIYHFFRHDLTPNQWNTITIDLSASHHQKKAIKTFEMAPVDIATVTYVFPYWGAPVTPKETILVPMIEDLSAEGVYSFGTNASIPDPYTVEVVPLTGDLATGFPENIGVNQAFKLTSKEHEGWVWWWVYTLTMTEGNYIPVVEGKSVLKFYVKSTGDTFVTILKNPGGGNEWYYSNYAIPVVPNEWSEVIFDMTGRAGTNLEIKFFEMATYTPNTTAYICPVWEIDKGGSAVNNSKVNPMQVPVCVDGMIKIKEDCKIELYNVVGKKISSTYGNSIKAIQGLNIVVVNGVVHKILN